MLLIIILIFALPIAWLASEYLRSPRWLCIVLGVCAIAMSFGVFHVGSGFERWNYNAWYGDAARKLLDAEIAALEGGKTEAVLTELRRFREELHPTYETRANYDELAMQAADRINAAAAQ
jgi:hypothetical protein